MKTLALTLKYTKKRENACPIYEEFSSVKQK